MTVSLQEKITIKPLGKHTGAEVTGIDLREPLDDETKQQLNAALVEWCCLVFPGQDLSPDDYIKAVALFSKPVEQNYSLYHLDGHPLINTVSNRHMGPEGKPVYHSAYWHTDHTNRECPPDYTVLYAVELPDEGGQTGVLNTTAGFEALPDAMKKRLDGLQTFNVQKGSAAKKASLKKVLDDDWKQFEKPMPQPLVRTHPVTGRKAIFVNTQFTLRIKGMKQRESQALLDLLYEQAHIPEYQFRLRWKPDTIALWDNRSTQHYAANDYYPNRRHMERVAVIGDEPV